ncbi:hypothetical protein [Methylobacterium iners]|uniref:Secreted protein n=1 Tax=Methylobacterium iners TaxID=418707 RepID=A0ABQ4S4Z9_9HYPH|nr:hypothetical protein [Methylobacterium iners]GJD96959.1 hypothetical protein OCOJLMKI_4187 [Methylobacterium iners]
MTKTACPRPHVLAPIGFGITLALCVSQNASAEPPIQSPQDAACRNEARAKVFTAPDPQGLGLHALGRQIHAACMQRSQGRRATRRKSR